MEKENLKTLFDRYIAGKATPEEIHLLLAHFRLEKEGPMLLDMILEQMAQPAENNPDTEQDDELVYERVYNRLDQKIGSETEMVVVPLWRRSWAAVAAAAILLIAFGIPFLLSHHNPQMIVVDVPYGNMKMITLPDSSKVWVNAGSHITYPAEFDAKIREVTLTEGQAFFSVIHKKDVPFKVLVKGIRVTVLGTSFDIKSFTNDKNTKVTVATGKVGINLNGETAPRTTFLLPQQQAIIMQDGQIKTKEVFTEIGSWRENRLIFDNETMEAVFHALERKYNVHIDVQDTGVLKEITSMKLENQPLTDVLTVLSYSKHFNYKFANDSTIVVK